MEKARMALWAVLLAVAVWASWVAVGMGAGRAVHSQQRVRLTAVLYVSQGSQQAGYSVVGSPSISASFIDRVLSAYRSPAAGLGSVIESQGVRYGIDPVYALAFYWHESGFGTTGEARVTLSPGNERCLPDRPCIDQDRGGYAQMHSWADGFEHLYIRRWGRVTVAQIIPKYAPSNDGNDEAAYIAAVEHAVDMWRGGQVWV